jgi:hypothetical protein
LQLLITTVLAAVKQDDDLDKVIGSKMELSLIMGTMSTHISTRNVHTLHAL